MDRRERYIARKNNPSSDIGNYDIDQLYNRLAPNYGDVEKFETFRGGENPRQMPFFIPPDSPIDRTIELPEFETTPLREGDYGQTFYPDQFEGYIPDKGFPDVLRQDTDPDSLVLLLDDLRNMGVIDYQGGIMDAFPTNEYTVKDMKTPGRDFEGATALNIPHISEYMNYFNTLSGRQVQGLGSVFKKMYRDAAIDKKLYDFYNA
tara:strand:- start:363 stop:977 length:615 start_codon:yes stop_codon:yes gene_type:complete